MSRAASALARWTRGLAGAFFPPGCAACAELGVEPFCPLCAEDLAPAPSFEVEGASASRAVFRYEGSARAAVQRLKYRGAIELGRSLGLLCAGVLPELGAFDVAVPVPLSRGRLAERGYNQARELARALPLPVRARALLRRSAPEQVGLGHADRFANVKDALDAGPERVRGLAVLLIDDVVTTGATAAACTRALLEAGAKSVAVLALTRADRRLS